jgi:hypothetical protein
MGCSALPGTQGLNRYRLGFPAWFLYSLHTSVSDGGRSDAAPKSCQEEPGYENPERVW